MNEMKKKKYRLLLPLLTAQEFTTFECAPLRALLSKGNLPALACFDVAICLVASSDMLDRATQSYHFQSLRRQVEIQPVSGDDLVLDYPFAVSPSLAYQKAIAACGNTAIETRFVFLQSNLILADGSLAAVAKHLERGRRVVTASYLWADGDALTALYRDIPVDDACFGPRHLMKNALVHLHAMERTKIVVPELHDPVPSGSRFHWTAGSSTLVTLDFLPALVAIQPSKIPGAIEGFRDVAFAPSLCPGETAVHFTDSDEFLGVELNPTSKGDVVHYFPTWDQLICELSSWTTGPQRQAVASTITTFHVDDIPSDGVIAKRCADIFVREILDALPPPRPKLDSPSWKLARYLWSVRHFELFGGTLQPGPFLEISPAQPDMIAAPGSRSHAVVEWLRTILLGRVPDVTPLHPEWSRYRKLKTLLRAAISASSGSILYICDQAPVLTRRLGNPTFSAVHLLDGTSERFSAGDDVKFAVIEFSGNLFARWHELADNVASALSTGGRILLFYRNLDSLSPRDITSILYQGLAQMKSPRRKCEIAFHIESPYSAWVKRGYPLAASQIRQRKSAQIVLSFIWLAMLTCLAVLGNLVALIKWPRTWGAAAPCSSVLVCIDI